MSASIVRVLLTGAAGRLGSVVCRELSAHGHEVVAVDGQYRADLPVKLHVVNLLDRLAVYPLVEGCAAVVHLANHPDMMRGLPPQMVYAENVALDANVFQAAFDTGVRQIVFSSSIQTIGGTRYGAGALARPSGLAYLPGDGNLPPNCGNLYALGKVAAENMLRFYAERDPARSYTAVRLPWLINAMERVRLPGQTVTHASNLDEMFAYLAHEDAAAFIRCVLAENRPGYACFLPAAQGTRIGWTVEECVRTFFPGVPLRRPLAEMKSLVDLDILRETYGWEPRLYCNLPRIKVDGISDPV